MYVLYVFLYICVIDLLYSCYTFVIYIYIYVIYWL